MNPGLPVGEDSTILIADPEILPLADENGKALEAHIIVQQLMLLPVGPGQIGGIPVRLIRMPINKRALGEFIEKAQAVHDQLVEPSDLAIASNMSQVDAMARAQKGIIGG